MNRILNTINQEIKAKVNQVEKYEKPYLLWINTVNIIYFQNLKMELKDTKNKIQYK